MSLEPFSVFFDGGMIGVEPRRDLTLILGRARAGDERAGGELIAPVYDQLRQVAARLMRHERQDHTLSPTAVVHEAVIRLPGDAVFDKSPDRAFLFVSAARATREALIDHARRRATDRRVRANPASARPAERTSQVAYEPG